MLRDRIRKVIKDYGNWVLVETIQGWKEGIQKHELGLVREEIRPDRKIHNR